MTPKRNCLIGQMSFFDLCNEKKSEMEELIERDLLKGSYVTGSKQKIYKKYRDVPFAEFIAALPGIYGLGGEMKCSNTFQN